MRKKDVLYRAGFLLFSLVLAVVCIAADQSKPRGDRAELDAFLSDLNASRRESPPWTEEELEYFRSLTGDFEEELDAFSPQELEALLTEHPEQTVLKEKAVQDLKTYFLLLKTAYGGYGYFGGDAVFLPLRDELIGKVRAYSKRKISASKLIGMLEKALTPVIRDYHFNAGSGKLYRDEAMFTYYVPDLYFDSSDGLDPEFVKPTIGPDGALAYCLAALSRDGSDLPGTMVYAGEELALSWRMADSYDLGERVPVAYERTNRSGVTVMTSQTLHGDTEALDRMAASGAEYRGLPALILDLRGNKGGGDGYTYSWVNGFTGFEANLKVCHATKLSQAFLAQLKNNPRYATQQGESWVQDAGEWLVTCSDGMHRENATPVFILTDRRTGSAGESSVDMMKMLDNVVLVGSNTSGSKQFGNVQTFFLPNTGIRVVFGATVAFYGEMENTEAVGITPDLWVNPPDALDAVVRLCKYYGLT